MICGAYEQPIRCVNFYGIETEKEIPVCSWTNPPAYYLSHLIKEWNLTTVRIPFSQQYISKHNFTALDSLINTTTHLNLTSILDWHRNENTHQSAFPPASWYHDWTIVLDRYNSNSLVMGVGLYNEFQTDDILHISQLQTELRAKLRDRYPRRFHYFVGCHTWGTNCTGLNVTVDNDTTIEIHRYPFNQGNYSEVFPIKPFIGETGWRDMKWGKEFLMFLSTNHYWDVCFWTISQSSDTGGVWEDDCMTINLERLSMMKSFWGIA